MEPFLNPMLDPALGGIVGGTGEPAPQLQSGVFGGSPQMTQNMQQPTPTISVEDRLGALEEKFNNFYNNFQNTSNMQGQTFNNFQRPFYSSFQRPSFFNNTSPFGLSMYSRGGIGGFLPFF
tara:strand:- start:56 stop:418 length:363 start_codon:yes stop_codon:yes gene_type:complete